MERGEREQLGGGEDGERWRRKRDVKVGTRSGRKERREEGDVERNGHKSRPVRKKEERESREKNEVEEERGKEEEEIKWR